MGLFDALLCIKHLIVMWGIGFLRKFIRPFTNRTETVWVWGMNRLNVPLFRRS